jgi:hypothetical protein
MIESTFALPQVQGKASYRISVVPVGPMVTQIAASLTNLGTPNTYDTSLSKGEAAVLARLESSIADGDLPQLQSIVQSFDAGPPDANLIMDTLANRLMPAGVYSSWQTINDAEPIVGHFGLYHHEKRTGTTHSLLVSTAPDMPASATQESAGTRQNVDPASVLRAISKAL